MWGEPTINFYKLYCPLCELLYESPIKSPNGNQDIVDNDLVSLKRMKELAKTFPSGTFYDIARRLILAEPDFMSRKQFIEKGLVWDSMLWKEKQGQQ